MRTPLVKTGTLELTTRIKGVLIRKRNHVCQEKMMIMPTSKTPRARLEEVAITARALEIEYLMVADKEFERRITVDCFT